VERLNAQNTYCSYLAHLLFSIDKSFSSFRRSRIFNNDRNLLLYYGSKKKREDLE